MASVTGTHIEYRIGSGAGRHYLSTHESGSTICEIQSTYTVIVWSLVGCDGSNHTTDRDAATTLIRVRQQQSGREWQLVHNDNDDDSITHCNAYARGKTTVAHESFGESATTATHFQCRFVCVLGGALCCHGTQARIHPYVVPRISAHNNRTRQWHNKRCMQY